MTLDHGLQQIRWVGRRHITGSMLAVAPHLRPIRVKAHALGRNDPHRDTLLSPQHRVLLTGWQAELVSGYREVLVPVKALVNDEEIRVISPPEGVVYHHILFDDHEIIWGDGLRSESLNPSRRALQGFDVQARAELLEIFPELDGAETQYPLARTLVGGAEMGLLAELYEKRT